MTTVLAVSRQGAAEAQGQEPLLAAVVEVELGGATSADDALIALVREPGLSDNFQIDGGTVR
jgi:hypothetical protein